MLVQFLIAPMSHLLGTRYRCCRCLSSRRRAFLLSVVDASNTWIRFIIVIFFELAIASFTGLYLSDSIISEPNEWDRNALLSAKIFTGLSFMFPLMLFGVIFYQITKLFDNRIATVEAALAAE